MAANQHERCNSTRVLRSIQARPGASTSPAHSRASASQFKGNNLPGTAAFILRCVAFIRCREHKPELKTQTQIRQGSPASSAVLQPVPDVAAQISTPAACSRLARAKASRNQGWQQGLICQSRRGRQVCRRKPQTKHCRVASDFHVVLAGLPLPSS